MFKFSMSTDFLSKVSVAMRQPEVSGLDLPKRIAAAMADQLKLDALAPGDRLPSEAVMTKTLGVSRPTLREGIRILQQSGVLEVRHGVGTFVGTHSPSIQDALEHQQSLNALVRAMGKTISARDLKVELVPAEGEVAEALQQNAGMPVLLIQRTRLADDVPLSASLEYLVTTNPVEDLRLLSQFDGSSLYAFLHDHMQLSFPESQVKLGAINADRHLARRLEIKANDALLVLRQTHFNETGSPRLYTISFQNSRIIEFTARRGVRN